MAFGTLALNDTGTLNLNQPQQFNPNINDGAIYLSKDNLSNLQNSLTDPNASGPFYSIHGMEAAQADAAGGATQTQPTPVDPYAKYGGQDAYNKLVNNYNAQEQNIYDSANRGIDQASQSYHSGIVDWLEKARQQQQNIDLQSAKNQLSRLVGQQGILGMVGRGIKSAGVMLGNRNAGDSSAVGAIARAYGDIGSREMSSIGNQFAQNQQGIDLSQQQLGQSVATQQRHNDETKQRFITDTINGARDQIAQLNLQKANADIPGQIAIDQKIEEIRQRATQALNQFDNEWSQGTGALQAASPQQTMSQAQLMRQAGTDFGQGQFNFTDQAPLTLQGSLPAGSSLPIFTMPRRRQ